MSEHVESGAVHDALQKFDGIASAAGERREPTEVEIVAAFVGVASLVGMAVDSLVRIANAATRLADVIDDDEAGFRWLVSQVETLAGVAENVTTSLEIRNNPEALALRVNGHIDTSN